MNPQALLDGLRDDGYAVVPSVLCATQCSQLLSVVVASAQRGHCSYVLQGELRLHAPVELGPEADAALRAIARVGGAAIRSIVGAQDGLVELSSIVVFPGAARQPAHPDHLDPRGELVSCFVNLAPTSGGNAPLVVWPASHRTTPERRGVRLELPAGSLVLMNGRLIHLGDANTTGDRIRPMFYATFGSADLEGPTYSIAAREKSLGLRLADFEDGPALGA